MKKNLCWKIPEIYALLNSFFNQLNKVSWIITKFGLEMPDTCGRNLGLQNYLSSKTIFPKPGGQENKKGPELLKLFLTLLHPIYLHLSPKLKHHVTCVNTLTNLRNDLNYSF